MLVILQATTEGRIQAIRSLAHDLENSRNPDARRARAVGTWLNTLSPVESTPRSVVEHVERLAASGLRVMDAYHLAWAEHLEADVLVTTDDAFASQCGRLGDIIRVRVMNPVALAGELPA